MSPGRVEIIRHIYHNERRALQCEYSNESSVGEIGKRYSPSSVEYTFSGVIDLDEESKEMLRAILHRVDLISAKVDSMDSKIEGLTEAMTRIEGQQLRQERLLNDHNHRIADVEQELRIMKQ